MRSRDEVKLELDKLEAYKRSERPDFFNNKEQIKLLDLQNRLRPVKIIEFLFFLFIAGLFLFVWTQVYKNPLPKFIPRLFGLDDTLYPEQYEELKAKLKQSHP